MISNTLVHRVCQTEFVRYYLLSLLRAHVINSETKQANQTQKRMFVGEQRDIYISR